MCACVCVRARVRSEKAECVVCTFSRISGGVGCVYALVQRKVGRERAGLVFYLLSIFVENACVHEEYMRP